MKHKLYIICIIFIILVVTLYLEPFIKTVESFTNSSYSFISGTFPNSINYHLLDDYKHIQTNTPSKFNYSDIWTQYPSFKINSFQQITNNIRFYDNPDQGNCIRADFCNAFYHNKKHKSNIVKPLPPAEEGQGARVGYFRTEPNELYFSIPTNENILY